MEREVGLLWSGGWDSTFRLLQPSRQEGLRIRSTYVRDHGRGGMLCELTAVRDILPDVGGQVRRRVVPKGECGDAGLVFGSLDLPMLGVSKKDALRVSKAMGWMPVMRKTWFCHAPTKGKPCGICNPCRDAMNEGMAWRMPPSSRLRYHVDRLKGWT